MMNFVREVFPLGRSLTGDGVRQTLAQVAERIPLNLHEVPTGTPVLDWEVPREWRVREAWIEGPDGQRIVDYANHNLHLLGYSIPVDGIFSIEELDEHLYSLPDQPDLIPYRTSYYADRWGFCLPHRQRESLSPGPYRVRIDSELFAGALTYGECLLPGESEETLLISSHCCHPSLANDNLSGMVVNLFLAIELAKYPRYHSFRFLFAPGTLGAITWLARNEAVIPHLKGGLIASNLGDSGAFHYKRSRQGDSLLDRAVVHHLTQRKDSSVIEDFVPFGYDERQYCSPGFNLAVGLLSRTPWGRYPEYHTSADNLEIISASALEESLELYLSVIDILEKNRSFRNLAPYGEPQLGRRGLYRTLGGDDRGREKELAMLWVLNQSDGEHSLLDIAERSGLPFDDLVEAATRLKVAHLLEVQE